jgi:hypothetical protein
MVEAEHRQAALARTAACGDVILRVDQEAVRVGRQVAAGNGLEDESAGAEENAATLRRPRRPRVRDHASEF